MTSPARQESLRTRNLSLVLNQIAGAAEPVSRADVAAATGLTRATVSALVDVLIEGGLVGELEPRKTRPTGRPATGLVLADDRAAGLGLEISVDYIAACVIDLAGGIRYQEVVQQDQRGRNPHEVLSTVADMAATAITAAERLDLTVAGAGVAVPGLVDKGLLRLAPNLSWRDVHISSLLARTGALDGLAITVDNEANFAALGELRMDRGAAPTDFLHVSGEIGVGAGIVMGGALFRGEHGWSGEIGHMAVGMDGPPCQCGAHGCLEQVAGQEAILRAAGLPLRAATSMGGQATVGRIVQAAEAGHSQTLAALRQAGRALGITIAGAVKLLDIGCVVLGGIYAPLGPWIQPEVQREVDLRVLSSSWSPVRVRISLAGTDASVLGAASSVIRAIIDDPSTWLRR
ncbi:ROK family transcriptional regulator [Streptomyces sp. NPDC002596]|uniref:ROK family transcriptional regulator n=1 Tax=unclassified Streptomyces TaxID=2593676 RepID=UPI0035E227AA